jgi:hypothetical protein
MQVTTSPVPVANKKQKFKPEKHDLKHEIDVFKWKLAKHSRIVFCPENNDAYINESQSRS